MFSVKEDAQKLIGQSNNQTHSVCGKSYSQIITHFKKVKK